MIRAGSSVRRNIARSSGGNTPKLDLLFTSGVLDSRVAFTRASSATDSLYTDAAASTFNSYSTNVARLLTAGLLIEEARTQQLLNSAAPVTQTTASLGTGTYVFWCIGTGSVTSSAGTATASGLGAITGSLGTFQTIIVTVAGTLTFTVSGSINRFQLELGAFPTSFISTAGATATRAADVATVATSAFAFNQNAGTLVYEGQLEALGGTAFPFPLTFDDGTGSNQIGWYYDQAAGNLKNKIASGGVSQFEQNAGVPTTAAFKTAQAWAANNGSLAYGGTISATKGATLTVPSGITTLRLSGAFGGSPPNSWLRRVRYYNTRLPDANLRALTQ